MNSAALAERIKSYDGLLATGPYIFYLYCVTPIVKGHVWLHSWFECEDEQYHSKSIQATHTSYERRLCTRLSQWCMEIVESATKRIDQCITRCFSIEIFGDVNR